MTFRRRFILIIIACTAPFYFCIHHTHAQQVDSSSALNPVGSGARATGMGGAFIGLADDATAASWNPAGLVQLEKPEVSAAYSFFHRKQVYTSPVHPEIDSVNTMDTDGLNFASIAYPFSLFRRNMIASLNYQRLYEMDKEIKFALNREVLGSVLTDDIEFTQEGFLYAVSPAYAVQITPGLSVGGTINIWDNALGANGWNSTYNSLLSGSISGNPIEIQFHQNEDVSFEGMNAHIGFLWHINGPCSLGGVYKSPFDADLRTRTTIEQPPNPPVSSTENRVMSMPASYGLGIACRYGDNWTAALDVYRTDWSKFVITDEDGRETNPLDGTPISSGRLKDTTQVRLGAEYLFIERSYVIPVRAGLMYDPEPGKGYLDEFYGFALGAGYGRDRIAIDISYQFRAGDDVTGDIPSVEGSNADIRTHTVMLSIIYYLGG